MNRTIHILVVFLLFSCGEKESGFSKLPHYSEAPLLVSDIGKSLSIIEINSKYPISGTPFILKSNNYYYLFEQGIVYSLHQIEFDGKIRKTLDFGYDDKLNGLAISQIFVDGERVGVVINGDKVIWLDENLEEIETEVLPIKAKFHFKVGQQTIAHTNQIDDDERDVVIYTDTIKSKYLPINKNLYPFYNQVFSPFSKWNGKVIFSKVFNDTVYIWDQSDFKPLFKVDFGLAKVTIERYEQIENAMDMIAFFSEKKYSFLFGEVYGLDSDKIMFQLNEKGKLKLAIMDFDLDKLTVFPGLLDNSISGLSLFSPQFVEGGNMYFGVSGEHILENYDKLTSSFKGKLSADYSNSFFIYNLELK
jgi:hypothetical protein